MTTRRPKRGFRHIKLWLDSWSYRRWLKERQKPPKIAVPRSLPSSRPRALSEHTIDQQSPWSVKKLLSSGKQKTSDQSSSLLLTKLPVELRRLIWRQVLGGYLLHIFRGHNRLHASRCYHKVGPELSTRSHAEGCWASEDLCLKRSFWNKGQADLRWVNIDFMPVLQTCRKVYSETVDMIYDSNIFDVNHVDTILYLQKSVLPQRLSHIRTLNFTWDFLHELESTSPPYDIASWRKACDVLKTHFTGLKNLTVHLPGLYPSHSWAKDTDVAAAFMAALDALKPVRASYKFEVYTFMEGIDGMDAEGYPFRLLPEPVEVARRLPRCHCYGHNDPF